MLFINQLTNSTKIAIKFICCSLYGVFFSYIHHILLKYIGDVTKSCLCDNELFNLFEEFHNFSLTNINRTMEKSWAEVSVCAEFCFVELICDFDRYEFTKRVNIFLLCCVYRYCIGQHQSSAVDIFWRPGKTKRPDARAPE